MTNEQTLAAQRGDEWRERHIAHPQQMTHRTRRRQTHATPQRMSERMSERMPERMPEPMPKQIEQMEQIEQIEPGMLVDATQGNLGADDDISQAKVKEVTRDARGEIEQVVVEKGLIFRKAIEVPVERVNRIEQSDTSNAASDGKGATVTIAASESELDALHAVGVEELPGQQRRRLDDDDDLLDVMEQKLPTEEGLRQKERETLAGETLAGEQQQDAQPARRHGALAALHSLGPG
ncbi:MAG: hypothetical protein ABI068_08720, partial [Ktedonobacterales bacterium]